MMKQLKLLLTAMVRLHLLVVHASKAFYIKSNSIIATKPIEKNYLSSITQMTIMKIFSLSLMLASDMGSDYGV